jgi:hypothetical protein
MAFPRFERRGPYLRIDLVSGRRVAGRVMQMRLGPLGAVIFSDPVSLAERTKFWAQMNERFRVIRERWPDRISPADEIEIRNKIGKRIPRAQTEAEFKVFLQATIVHDMTTALERQDAGLDGMREAAKQLLRLTRQERAPKRQTEKQGG